MLFHCLCFVRPLHDTLFYFGDLVEGDHDLGFVRVQVEGKVVFVDEQCVPVEDEVPRD